MIMRTFANFGGFTIVQDLNGNILMNGKQYDGAMDAAYDAPEAVKRDLIKQVRAVQGEYIDGIAAYDNWKNTKAVIVEDGLKELDPMGQLMGDTQGRPEGFGEERGYHSDHHGNAEEEHEGE